MHLFMNDHRPSRASFMHASIPFDAKCFHGGGCSLSKRIGGLVSSSSLSLSLSLSLYFSLSNRRGGARRWSCSYSCTISDDERRTTRGDTTMVLSLHLGLELLKYRILPGRDRFLRVNDTKIVCRPRGDHHVTRARRATGFTSTFRTSRRIVFSALRRQADFIRG